MTKEELIEILGFNDGENFLKFPLVEKKLSTRKDLHAFILLNELVPGTFDIVCCAEHDEIWLEVTPDELAAVATKEQLIDLCRCGVRYDSSADSLAMFV